ncbi:MAG: hypothetical protein ACRD4Q_07765 [Candidatus Acidiferrales bacterium]
MTTTADIEARIAQTIPGLLRELGVLPDGYVCEVRLQGKVHKKHRDADFERNWDPNGDSIRIGFKRRAKGETAVAIEEEAAPSDVADDTLRDLVRALDRAERRPGYEFVSLKWFRDTALAGEGYSWAADASLRHNVLRDAIDRRWILTSKVANPRPPNFPVTAIRLNRQIPDVNAVLGGEGGSPLAFRPVAIRGETLSATVLRDRR